MTPNEETEVLSGIRELRSALLGSLDGRTEGALHRIERLHEDFYHPSNPRESIHVRVKTLEDRENRRTGFLAALSVAGGAVGFAITTGIAWLAGKNR